MCIKYAEITIIRNIEEENVFRTLSRYFGYENTTDNKDMIIIIFDNGSIYDTKDEYIDKKYNFGQFGYIHKFPIYKIKVYIYFIKIRLKKKVLKVTNQMMKKC